MGRQIVVLVTPEGETETVVKGISGPSCIQASKFLTDSLGQVSQDVKTEEYEGFEMVVEEQTRIKQVQRNGY